ncbi:P-loop containing nucleoside triphosphate hydrolase protein [Trametes gibbosa]|nr:P-loop containing nucleoside triphosphate hydrolase protein [Trametes gibbosa]
MAADIERICPAQLFAGGCSTSNCPLLHHARYCELCSLICVPASLWTVHINGRRHTASAARGGGTLVVCSICNVRLSGETTWLEHVSSTSHRTTARERQTSAEVCPRDPSRPETHNYCIVCRRPIEISSWNSHLQGIGHQRAQSSALYRARFEQAERNQRGVSISLPDGVDFGVVSLAECRQGIEKQVVISLDDSERAIVVITRVETFSGSSSRPSPAFSASISTPGQRLSPGRPATVVIRLHYQNRGRCDGRLEVHFKNSTTQATFIVIRQLRAIVGDAANHQLLQPAAPYVRRGRAPWKHGGAILDGNRPPALGDVVWVKKLPPSLIPSDLNTILGKGATRETINAVRTRFLPGTLGSLSHGQHFRVLLWTEEFRLVEDLRMYDIEDARFTKEGGLYTLPVPGLAEKRPSVVPGDVVLVQVNGTGGRTYRGYIHQVRRDDIRIGFHTSFDGNARYNVRFEYNRTPIKRQHQALLAPCTSSQRLLFPLPGHEGLVLALTPEQSTLTLFNAQIATNLPQYQAVRSILRLRTGSGVFIVFGPPGTGKTVTLVEAIRQILVKDPNARMLVCAPSNSAADLLAQRLSALSASELFRCNALFRDRLTLPEDLVPYSLYRDNHFSLPALDTLLGYKVIATTCGNASFAYNIGIPNGHFTHIFVDEAGQASEPEILTAIKTIVADRTHVILSGDPKQLGPVIRSSVARELGLGTSYLERLMERPVYDAQTGRGRSFVKLVKNYRSHQAILDFPNERFYNNELQVCGAPATINALLGSPMLVNRRWPVVFHYISGENERESTSPSYFNIDEATEVLDYIKELLRDRRHPVRAEEIGVITPYYAQVRKIRLLLRDQHLEGVKVGSVEEFQGQERKVIIVSTVRSTRDLLSYDAKFTLGFVSNPRRFNVAITRAQALLVIIGDASVLSIDPLWRAFMNYIHAHGGWRGDAPTWDTTLPVQMDGNYAAEIRDAAAGDMDEFMARLAEGEDVEGEANVDHPFAEAE